MAQAETFSKLNATVGGYFDAGGAAPVPGGWDAGLFATPLQMVVS